MYNAVKFNQSSEVKLNTTGSPTNSNQKEAQFAPAPPINPIQPVNNSQLFPVKDAADLSTKFMEQLLSKDYNVYAQAMSYILSQVQGEIQEQDIKGILESFWNLDYNNQSEVLKLFGNLYEMLPAKLKVPTKRGSYAMENPKGIIKYNLSQFVLNNQKTAADHFGHEYMLYGPTEKRKCPKLSGKGIGDVVSEYVCRHHCLDGIVIDDNKTICGEALWRANVMDKFSREYVDEDGNSTGGYINKRFEVNRNVPEENKMRLKPGETRKPRPANMGNLESRMQDMRNKEGEKRGYGPTTDTSEPFKWCSDVDQNNMDVKQSTRDTREENSGHETVDHVSKDKIENNPKVASFNLSKAKTAQRSTFDQFGEDPASEFGYDEFEDTDGFDGSVDNFEEPTEDFSLKGVFFNSLRNAGSVEEIESIQNEINESASLGKLDPKTAEALNRQAEQLKSDIGFTSDDLHDQRFDETPLEYGMGSGFDEYAATNKDGYQYKFAQVYDTGHEMNSDADIPENPQSEMDMGMPMDNPMCPICQGDGVPLGTLGNISHFRCRSCGMPFSKDANTIASSYKVDLTKLAETSPEEDDNLKKKLTPIS